MAPILGSGGAGESTLRGGDGRDRFVFDAGDRLSFQAPVTPGDGRLATFISREGVDGDADGSLDDTVELAFHEDNGVNVFFKAVVLQDVVLELLRAQRAGGRAAGRSGGA
ncbi:MAG: hypothetical protein U1E14_19110 [Geminicoccaceae bacterium]